jgi:O-antigen/teichoic acid export membrane protein
MLRDKFKLNLNSKLIKSVKSSFLLTIARGSTALLTAIWLTICARSLAPYELGNLTLIIALGSIFTVLSDFGLQSAVAIDVAKHFRINFLMIKLVIRKRLILSLLSSVLLIVFYMISATGKDIVLPLIYAITFFAISGYNTLSAAMRSLNRVLPQVIIDIAGPAFLLVIGTIFIKLGFGLQAIVGIYPVIKIVSFMALYFSSHKYFGEESIDELPKLKLKNNWYYGLANLFTYIYSSIDIWLVALISGSAISGRYAILSRILEVVMIPSLAIGQQSVVHAVNIDSDRKNLHDVIKLSLLAVLSTLPAVAFIVIFAHIIISFIFGYYILGLSSVLILLMVSAPAGAFILSTSFASSIRSQKIFIYSYGLGLILNVSLNLIFIPFYGSFGAAMANLFSDVVLALLVLVALMKNSK